MYYLKFKILIVLRKIFKFVRHRLNRKPKEVCIEFGFLIKHFVNMINENGVEREECLAKKYNIDLEVLKREQLKRKIKNTIHNFLFILTFLIYK